MRKICFIIDSMKNSGGRERVVSLLSKEFIKKYIVKILVLDGDTSSFYNLDDRVIVESIRSKNKIYKFINLHKYLKKNSDYIYITLSMRYLNLFISASAIFTKSKIIATEHCDYFTTPKLFRIAKRIFYRKFIYVVTLTEKDRKIISRWFENVIQIDNPSSFESKFTSNYDNNIILNVGRLSEQKGQDMLLDAWSKVNRKNWKLVIVGEGEKKNNLLKQIKRLGLSDSVIIKDPVKNIENIYSSADVFVLSSRWEGLPMVLIEAMSFGLPCISFDCETGPRQLIKDNYNGYLVAPNEVEELSNCIEKVINNKDIVIKFGKNSLEESKRFNIDNISLKWYSIINKIENS